MGNCGRVFGLYFVVDLSLDSYLALILERFFLVVLLFLFLTQVFGSIRENARGFASGVTYGWGC